MAHQLKAYTPLAEDLSSGPIAHSTWFTSALTPSPRNLVDLVVLF